MPLSRWCSLASLCLSSSSFSRQRSGSRSRVVRLGGWAKLGVLCLLLLAGGQGLQAQSTIATDTVGAYPAGIAANPATNIIYVTNHDSNTMSVINGANNTVIATIPVGNHPMAIGVNPVTNTVYVGNYGETTVSVINGATNAVTATLTVGTNPAAIAVDSAANVILCCGLGQRPGLAHRLGDEYSDHADFGPVLIGGGFQPSDHHGALR
jgi:YVTN family beta-propeller protein